MQDDVLLPGTIFDDRFEIQDQLGRGGMGIVYAAIDRQLEREVALKIIARRLAGDPTFVARFEREGKAIAALAHENIVRVHHTTTTRDGDPYLVMERLKGETLRQRMEGAGGRLELELAVYIMCQLADAVVVAHEHHVWHRDIKPENVLVSPKDHVWLLDFGLAKRTAVTANTDEARPMGTVRYLPPEVVTLRTQGDWRVDFYQMGIVFFEMLTGRFPYPIFEQPSADAQQIMMAHVLDEPLHLRDVLPNAPARAEEVIGRCLEKDREHRYQSAKGLADDLYALLLDVVPADHRFALKMKHRRAARSEWPPRPAKTPESDRSGPETPPKEIPVVPQRTITLRPEPMWAPVDHSPSWLPAPRASQPAITPPAASDRPSSSVGSTTVPMQAVKPTTPVAAAAPPPAQVAGQPPMSAEGAVPVGIKTVPMPAITVNKPVAAATPLSTHVAGGAPSGGDAAAVGVKTAPMKVVTPSAPAETGGSPARSAGPASFPAAAQSTSVTRTRRRVHVRFADTRPKPFRWSSLWRKLLRLRGRAPAVPPSFSLTGGRWKPRRMSPERLAWLVVKALAGPGSEPVIVEAPRSRRGRRTTLLVLATLVIVIVGAAFVTCTQPVPVQAPELARMPQVPSDEALPAAAPPLAFQKTESVSEAPISSTLPAVLSSPSATASARPSPPPLRAPAGPPRAPAGPPPAFTTPRQTVERSIKHLDRLDRDHDEMPELPDRVKHPPRGNQRPQPR